MVTWLQLVPPRSLSHPFRGTHGYMAPPLSLTHSEAPMVTWLQLVPPLSLSPIQRHPWLHGSTSLSHPFRAPMVTWLQLVPPLSLPPIQRHPWLHGSTSLSLSRPFRGTHGYMAPPLSLSLSPIQRHPWLHGSTSLSLSHPFRGTHGYMAPEVIRKGVQYTFTSDWFSLGCVFYKLLRG